MRTQSCKNCQRICFCECLTVCRTITEYCKAESEDQWTYLSDIIVNNISECSEMLDTESVVRMMSPFEVFLDKLSYSSRFASQNVLVEELFLQLSICFSCLGGVVNIFDHLFQQSLIGFYQLWFSAWCALMMLFLFLTMINRMQTMPQKSYFLLC